MVKDDANYRTPYILASGLRKTYGQTVALQDASISVNNGEVVAILGASGSGKSTLLHCVAGLQRPDQGTVRVAGREIQQLGEPDLTLFRRQHFGFVFQSPGLLPELSVLDNVLVPAWLAGSDRSETARVAEEVLRRLGILQHVKKLPGQLSGGEAQRVGIARALVTRPAVVIADEPTGALDEANSDVVADLLVGTAREFGSAVLMATHDHAVAARADRQVQLRSNWGEMGGVD